MSASPDQRGEMTPPQGSESWRRIDKLAALALMSSCIVGSWQDLSNQSGRIKQYNPIVRELSPSASPGFTVASWNIADQPALRYKQVEQLVHTHDVVALQEVPADSAESLPGNHKVYVWGDRKQKPFDGGYGDMIISKWPITNIKTKSIKGTSLLASIPRIGTGFRLDAQCFAKSGFVSLRHTSDGIQENRAAISFTIKKPNVPKALSEVEFVEAHIGYAGVVHDRQLTATTDFINDSQKKNRVTIFMGDLNETPHTLVPKLARIGMKVALTANSTATDPEGRHIIIDYIAQDSSAMRVETNTIPGYTSDHRAIEARVYVPQAPLKYSLTNNVDISVMYQPTPRVSVNIPPPETTAQKREKQTCP
jgi:endonuclease/exonuclease/phosphatase family metal-dependent hydrolase